MSYRSMGATGAVVATLLIAGCESEPMGPNAGAPLRQVGVLEYNGNREPPDGIDHHFPDDSDVGYIRPPQPLEVPDSVERGVPFAVAATTVGDGCTRAHGAEVSYEGNVAEITAYDVQEGETCIQIARFLTREVTLRFDTLGEATVRLIGRRIQNDLEQPEPVVIARRITVY